jgi:CcmD family protein
MSPNLLMLFAGLAVVWLVLFVYLYYLSRQVQAARFELEELRGLAERQAQEQQPEPTGPISR